MLTSFPQVISKHQNYLKLCNLSITYLEEGSNVKLIIKVIILLLEVGVIRFAFDAHSNLIYFIVLNQDRVIIIPPCEFMFLLLKCCCKGLHRGWVERNSICITIGNRVFSVGRLCKWVLLGCYWYHWKYLKEGASKKLVLQFQNRVEYNEFQALLRNPCFHP